MRIVILDDDRLFVQGLQALLTSLFGGFCGPVEYADSLSAQSVAWADLLVLKLSPGEARLCWPVLRFRGRGMVVGILDRAASHPASPSCFGDIRYIQRTDPVWVLKSRFMRGWNEHCRGRVWRERYVADCHGCRCQHLSTRQAEVASLLVRGWPVSDIAGHLAVSRKTVFTHKFVLMQKFGLKNDHELFRFLVMLREKNPGMLP
jgi:DNA-binding CsgD family transcriptional regulator